MYEEWDCYTFGCSDLVKDTNVTLLAKVSCFLIQSGMSMVFRAEDTSTSMYLVNMPPSLAIRLETLTDMLGELAAFLILRVEEEEYPFINKYLSFQEEPIVLVEEESCHVYDTDNEEDESMMVYDTDIEDVIEEEEEFVRKGGFGGEKDNIEDIVVVVSLEKSNKNVIGLQIITSYQSMSV
nr:hypothetical protein [Tanacetum cinerariifolium]